MFTVNVFDDNEMKINANTYNLIGPLTNKLSSTECEVIPVDSHSANISHNKFSSFFENGVPAAAHSHNHTDIVHFVGSGIYFSKYSSCNMPRYIFTEIELVEFYN